MLFDISRNPCDADDISRNLCDADKLIGTRRHIHLQQTEYFEVQQGVLGLIKNEQEYKLTRESGPISIPAGTR